jgi:ABC-type branched-subunit amino acid transport system substrate-binding protein
VGAADDPGRKCDTPWFRLAPSAKSLGEALAKQAHSQLNRVAVLYSTSPYDRALGGAAATRFKTLGGDVVLELELNPEAQSYANVISTAIDAGVSDVILAASPRAAAILVNEYDALSSKKPHWFLSPLLKTELLVQNVAPQALEGAQGIAPGIYQNDASFQTQFSERWEGDTPLEGAYFYYDAMALLAITLAKAERDDTVSLPAAMLDAAGPPGEGIHWDQLDVGVQRQLDGDDLYYSGLTGPISLDQCGGRSTGTTTNWTVQNRAIVNVSSK